MFEQTAQKIRIVRQQKWSRSISNLLERKTCFRQGTLSFCRNARKPSEPVRERGGINAAQRCQRSGGDRAQRFQSALGSREMWRDQNYASLFTSWTAKEKAQPKRWKLR